MTTTIKRRRSVLGKIDRALRPGSKSVQYLRTWRERMERGEYLHNAYTPGPPPNGWGFRK
jgi:hypothetical protein